MNSRKKEQQQISKIQGYKYTTQKQTQIHEKQKNSVNQAILLQSKQCYKQQQLQDQALIQYYIFEDYQNLINLIYSLQTVNEFFKDDPDNEMVVLCRNKVINQLNLSNTIHLDIQETYKDQDYAYFIKQEKQKVKELVSHLPPNIQNSIYLQMYSQRSLSENIQSTHQELEKMDSSFISNVVSQIFSSMHIVDQKVSQIQSQKYYKIPSPYDVLDKAQQYQSLTQIKLEASYGQKLQSSSPRTVNLKQPQAQNSLVRSKSCKNHPTKLQQEIQNQPKEKKQQQSNQQAFQGNQNNHLKGLINLANC
ncbi:unnamed protein product (macronuclear) [Paramecium tetraurelia]|uniref:GLTSCR protein conserved domain-containing protein n=1 Tax=Paramecium tetraurelia TaxID=5888 RepID=A0DWX9_PARTE|nr:uncharacterized protein GSPATT00039810001 [Paramecium tetraurelia]CAK87546.1 unnamed protein product [Paramecium tetraurelia]|eukprot:XP_001454943.1 hypothetical protein (macronuclear) [Paramecium tetraurelia strain d4-2]